MTASIRAQSLRTLLTLLLLGMFQASALAQADIDTPGPNFTLSADSPFIASGNTAVNNENAPTKIHVEFGYFNGSNEIPLDYYWPVFPVMNTTFWTVQLTAYRYPFEVTGGHYYIKATFFDWSDDTGMYEHSGFDGHVGQLQ